MREKKPSQEMELNLAPIIDCFTVLITYLLVGASFVAIAAIDTGIAVFKPNQLASSTPGSTLEVRILPGGRLALALHGDGTPTVSGLLLPLEGTGELPRRLASLVASVPGLSDVTVSAAPGVTYGDVVRTIELARKQVPRVYLNAGIGG